MFSFSGLLKTLGIVLLVFISISFMVGFINVSSIGVLLTLMYSLCYLLTGILAPIWNNKTPYFASYIASLTLTVINFLVGIFLLDVMVLADPMEINSSIVFNTSISLVGTFIVVNIIKKRQGNNHA